MARSDGSVAAANRRSLNRVRMSRPAAWLLHHRLALSGTLTGMARDRLNTALVVLTIGIALALPGLLAVSVASLADLTERWDGTPRINVFLSGADAEARALAWIEMADVAAVRFQSPEGSLAELAGASGFGDLLDGIVREFDGNPLPAVAIVTPAEQALAPARMRALAADLELHPGVEGVQVDLEWLQRMQFALVLVERLAWGLGVLLAGAVLLVIASLIRMAVEQRREEIRVLKLVGGSDGFVLRPFLYLGVVFGLAGGVTAWLLLAGALAWFGAPAADLARSYGSDFRLGGVTVEHSLALLAGGALLGWTGALLAAWRQLRAIEP